MFDDDVEICRQRNMYVTSKAFFKVYTDMRELVHDYPVPKQTNIWNYLDYLYQETHEWYDDVAVDLAQKTESKEIRSSNKS